MKMKVRMRGFRKTLCDDEDEDEGKDEDEDEEL